MHCHSTKSNFPKATRPREIKGLHFQPRISSQQLPFFRFCLPWMPLTPQPVTWALEEENKPIRKGLGCVLGLGADDSCWVVTAESEHSSSKANKMLNFLKRGSGCYGSTTRSFQRCATSVLSVPSPRLECRSQGKHRTLSGGCVQLGTESQMETRAKLLGGGLEQDTGCHGLGE